MNRSPVLLVVLRLLRIGLLFCAASVALIFAIEIWKNWFSGADHEMAVPDLAFLAVLVAIFAAALALVRSIAREVRKMETMGRENHE
jgi:fucose 4-O-acetylase-like acetyltransferase